MELGATEYILVNFVFIFFLSFCLFRVTPVAYRSSWAKAEATSLHHSQSNMGSKPRLQPTPQLIAILDL